MNRTVPEKKRERVKARVIAGGVKAARRQKIDPSDVTQLQDVRVQMMSPAKRIVLAVIGLALCGLPFLGWLSICWMILFIPVGLVFLAVSINGKKKAVGEACEEVGVELVGEALSEVLGGIFSGL